MSIEVNVQEPEDPKWDKRVVRVESAGNEPLSKTISGIALETFRAGTPDAQTDIVISPTGDVSNGSARKNGQQIKELLEASGYEGLKVGDYGSVTIPSKSATGVQVDEKSLPQLMQRLATAPNENMFALLNQATAQEVIGADLATRNVKPSAIGLLEISTTPATSEHLQSYGIDNAGTNYLDTTIPHGPVDAIRETSSTIDFDSKRMAITSSIGMREPHKAAAVAAALEQDGLQATVHRGKDIVRLGNIKADGIDAAEDVLSGRVKFTRATESATSIKFTFDSPDDAHLAVSLLESKSYKPKYTPPETHVTTKGTSDQVATALSKKGLMPDYIAGEIVERANAAHPDQPRINREINAAVDAKAATTAPDIAQAPQQQMVQHQMPQQQQMQQQQTQLKMSDEERIALASSQHKAQQAMLDSNRQERATSGQVHQPLEIQQQQMQQPAYQQMTQQQQQQGRVASADERRAPDSPMRTNPTATTAQPSSALEQPAWDYGAKPDELADKFGRPLRTDARTGKPQDPIAAGRALWENRQQQTDEFRAREVTPAANDFSAANDAPRSIPAGPANGTSASLNTATSPVADAPTMGTAELRTTSTAGNARLATAEQFSKNAILAQNDNIGHGATSATITPDGPNASVERVVVKPKAKPLPTVANDIDVPAAKAPVPAAAVHAEVAVPHTESTLVRAASEVAQDAARVRGPGIKAGIAGAVVGAVIRGGMTALDKDASGMQVAGQAGLGVVDALVPGASDGFADIRGMDKSLNWGDRALAVLDTATGATATGALAAAPVTAGGSLTVTAVAGVGNLAVGLVKDVGYSTGLTHRPGLITGGASIVTTIAKAYDDHQEFVARKDDIPQPVVQQFISGLASAKGPTQDKALDAFLATRDLATMEHTKGIVQSASSQARFGNLPMGQLSSSDMNDRIDEAARTYIANGGSLELAMTALQGGNLAQSRSNLLIQDLINLVPTKSTEGKSYPTGVPALEQLKTLKQQHENDPNNAAVSQQMEQTAATYLNAGHTAREALTSYYHLAPFGVSNVTMEQLEQNKNFMRGMDGADGTKTDGRLTTRELGAGLAKLGVYSDKMDSNRDGEGSYAEIITAKNTPSEFQTNTPSKGRG